MGMQPLIGSRQKVPLLASCTRKTLMETPTANKLPLSTSPTTTPQTQHRPRQHTTVLPSMSRTPKDAPEKASTQPQHQLQHPHDCAADIGYCPQHQTPEVKAQWCKTAGAQKLCATTCCGMGK